MHPAARDLSLEPQPHTIDEAAALDLDALTVLARRRPLEKIRVRRDLYDLRAKDGKPKPNWAPAGRKR